MNAWISDSPFIYLGFAVLQCKILPGAISESSTHSFSFSSLFSNFYFRLALLRPMAVVCHALYAYSGILPWSDEAWAPLKAT